MDGPSAFRVGDWLVEPPLNRVSRGDRSIHVRRQLTDLLVFLASRPGRVVSKEEIFRAVWPDQFVAESGLARCISQLRDVFEDDPREPRFIETIPTRGYRLVAPVTPVEADPPLMATSPPPAAAPIPAGAEERPVGALAQDASDLAVTPPTPAGSTPPVAARRRWPAAAAASVGIVAAVIAGWLVLRTPVLAGRDTLLVTFENRTGDPVFDDTLRLALTIQLEQSPELRVVPEERVREELRFMNREPDEPVTRVIGMDACERVGAKAVLIGSLTRLGGEYVIGLEGVECPSGRMLVRRQAEVSRREEVIGALGRVASDLRRRLGESVASIERHDVPLVQATTPSLEALKALSVGDNERARGRDAEAIEAYRRAIDADPEFALAWGRLGVHLLGLTRTGEAIDALRRAFALRHRASAGERLYITSYYYGRVVRDPFKAVAALEAWRDTHPRSAAARLSLGERCILIGRFDEALAEGREALRLDPGNAAATAVVVEALMGLERLDDARRAAEALVESGRGNATTRVLLLQIAFAQGDVAAMRRQLDWAAANPAAESLFATVRAAIAMAGGRMHESRVLLRQRAERAEARGDSTLAALTASGLAFHEAFVGAAEEVEALTAMVRPEAGTPEIQLRAALALALVERTDAADQRLSHYLGMPDVEAGSDPGYRVPTQALIAIQRGRPDEAIEMLASVKPYEVAFACIPTYVRGLAHRRAGRPGEAAAEFAAITTHRSLASALIYPVAWLQLGRAHAAAGDAAAARRAYERFLQLWKDADPDVPALLQARAELGRLKEGSGLKAHDSGR